MSGRVHTESVEDDNSLSYTNKPLPVDLFFKTFEGPQLQTPKILTFMVGLHISDEHVVWEDIHEQHIMLKSHRLVGYEFPHVVLVLRFIYYFNVDVSNEIVDFTKTFSEITERHIKKLGMRFVDHEWIMVGEPVAGNIDGMEEDAEAEAPQEPAHQWSPFESLMIKKMDDMLHLYQEH
ncbi:hypothetical protein JHK85_010368 [Glycine max]|nr:hypothetical protein JHK85_010368 [Glycine max]